MAKLISNVTFMPAVEGVSRKFALRREKCVNTTIGRGNSYVSVPGKTYMGCVSRSVNIVGVGPVLKNTFFMRRPMAKRKQTNEDLLRQTRFVAANEWGNSAFRDLSTLTQNMAKWNAAKADLTKTISGISASGYQSMTGWAKAIAYAYSVDKGSVPSTTALPEFDS